MLESIVTSKKLRIFYFREKMQNKIWKNCNIEEQTLSHICIKTHAVSRIHSIRLQRRVNVPNLDTMTPSVSIACICPFFIQVKELDICNVRMDLIWDNGKSEILINKNIYHYKLYYINLTKELQMNSSYINTNNVENNNKIIIKHFFLKQEVTHWARLLIKKTLFLVSYSIIYKRNFVKR